MRRALIFNYNSRFAVDVVNAIHAYNLLRPRRAFLVDVYNAEQCFSELQRLPADVIIHSGGDGRPVREDALNTPKLYICHSQEGQNGRW